MFTDTIRSFLLLQFALIAVSLSKFLFDGHTKRCAALRMGVFACMIGILLCDARLLPEILGVALVLINLLLLNKEIPDFSARRFGWMKLMLYLSLFVFSLFFIFRARALNRMDCAPLGGVRKDESVCGTMTADGVISMIEAERMVKAAYEYFHGEGSYEKSRTEMRETDSAYVFSSSFPGQSNYVFEVMKKDGRVFSSIAISPPNDGQDEN